MKTPLLFLVFIAAGVLNALSQGSLTPPGAPAPTMKTLDQIEPTRPLVVGQTGVAIGATGTITISQPGSYYLTGNLTVTGGNGIIIASSDVSLDLRGFTIASSVDGGTGISIEGVSRTDIRHGTIRGGSSISGNTFTFAGFNNGIVTIVAPALSTLATCSLRAPTVALTSSTAPRVLTSPIPVLP